MTTKDETKAAVETILAVAEAIRELKEVPTGHLYAVLCGKLELQTFQKIIGMLKNAGLVTEANHVLTWKEPTK